MERGFCKTRDSVLRSAGEWESSLDEPHSGNCGGGEIGAMPLIATSRAHCQLCKSLERPQLSIVRLHRMPIFQQLQIEEALFRAGDGNWCLLNDGTDPAIVMGICGSSDDVASNCPFPIIRRFTGGGTVVVDEETVFFSLILNGSDLPCSSTPHDVMRWSLGLLHPAFLPSTLCLEEQDYVLDGQKVGGNAQSFGRGRLVHHTSFLWSWQEERMALLSMPQRQPAYRAQRGHEAFCNRLSKYFPSKAKFIRTLLSCVESCFSCREGSFEEAQQITRLPHRKALTMVSLSFVVSLLW
jgi:lipoate-protein ligase A